MVKSNKNYLKKENKQEQKKKGESLEHKNVDPTTANLITQLVTRWLTGGRHLSVDALDGWMIHNLGGMEKYGAKFTMLLRTAYHLKHESFLSGTSHFIFLNLCCPQATWNHWKENCGWRRTTVIYSVQRNWEAGMVTSHRNKHPLSELSSAPTKI